MHRKNEKAGQNNLVSLKIIDKEPTDISCRVCVNLMQNGFALKHKNEPVFYPTIEECAEAVKQGLIAAFARYETHQPPY